MEEDFNPYAAPKADVVVSSADAGVPRRPRVVKWTTFILGLCTVAVIYLYSTTISVYGAVDVWKHQPLFDLPLFMPVGFLLCLFRRRDKISFGAVALLLGWILWRALSRLLPKWTAPHAFAAPWIGERIGELLITFGLAYLFYRFTFGLPSRTYFGMVRQGGDEQRPRQG